MCLLRKDCALLGCRSIMCIVNHSFCKSLTLLRRCHVKRFIYSFLLFRAFRVLCGVTDAVQILDSRLLNWKRQLALQTFPLIRTSPRPMPCVHLYAHLFPSSSPQPSFICVMKPPVILVLFQLQRGLNLMRRGRCWRSL